MYILLAINEKVRIMNISLVAMKIEIFWKMLGIFDKKYTLPL